MTNGRKRTAAALTTLCIALVGGSVVTASPSVADPDIDDVRARADDLYHRAEKASERFNTAKLRLQKAEKRLDRLQHDIEEREERVEELRGVVATQVVSYYQGDSISMAGQLATAEDPDAFIGQMQTISEYTSQQAAVIDELTAEVDTLGEREQDAEEQAKEIAATKEQLAGEKQLIDRRADEAEALLERLEEKQRESRSASPVVGEVAASGSAGAAVQQALAQVGDAYVYGATGPDAFDCSGLTMFAWAAAGVSLPHSSSAQMGSGTPVSIDALQPGDLVFYYSPVSHVGMYIGNGQLVHAANPSTGVQVTSVDSMPISGAVRPG
ncbi:C40 family peptidase [Nocardioides caldifontis]|uniref:C40 family peptidase n=1 Tax=Nocardioides caldifontis TaxID=2588938 RepID=UPI001EF077F2|nr:C40 family peptidase [Nocardioides caldifontis]